MGRARRLIEGARRCESVGGRGTAVHALMGLAQLEAEAGDPERAADLFRRCLKTTESIGDIGCMAVAWRGLASLARREGEHERALGLLRRSLLTSARLGHHGDIATTLIEVADVAADAGRLDRAGELLGAIESGTGSSGIPLVPADELAKQRLLERAEAALGRSRFRRPRRRRRRLDGRRRRGLGARPGVSAHLRRGPEGEPIGEPVARAARPA